jgi:hypothetical protein
MRKGTVAFANFICTFGDAGGLLDNWDIVGPAFLTDSLVRKYGKNDFHLYDVQLQKFANDDNGIPIVAVCGRFIKNTLLTREQTFDDAGSLIKSHAHIASSPSAFFVLVLNTHRLIYFAETAHSPDLKSFEATMASFIKKLREKKINQQYDDADGRVTKISLRESLPRPTLNVVPLAERDRLADFVSRFNKIKTVKFRLIKPNHESDASKVVSAVRERFGPLEPDYLDITASSSDGLDKPEVQQAVEEAGETGNTNIVLKGEGLDGEKLSGTADEFALTTQLENPAKADTDLSTQLYSKYKSFVQTGKIKLGQTAGHAADLVSSIAALL